MESPDLAIITSRLFSDDDNRPGGSEVALQWPCRANGEALCQSAGEHANTSRSMLRMDLCEPDYKSLSVSEDRCEAVGAGQFKNGYIDICLQPPAPPVNFAFPLECCT